MEDLGAGEGPPRTGKRGSSFSALHSAPPRVSWPLLVLFLINVLNFYDRQALGAITEPLRREFRLSDTQVGALATTFTLVYALAGVPLGRLADTWNRKHLLAIGVSLWASLTAMGGAAVNYGMLLFSRLGVGVGEAVCGPVAASWVGDLVPPERRARALARLMMAVPVGGMLSFAVTGPVAQAYGWRAALVVAALPALILVPALLRLKEPERTQISGTHPKPSGAFGTLLRDAAFRWIIVSGAVVNFARP